MKLMELYQDKIIGAIKGLDRIRFRGTLRWLANEIGMRKFLSGSGILLKDFTAWAKGITAEKVVANTLRRWVLRPFISIVAW